MTYFALIIGRFCTFTTILVRIVHNKAVIFIIVGHLLFFFVFVVQQETR